MNILKLWEKNIYSKLIEGKNLRKVFESLYITPDEVEKYVEMM